MTAASTESICKMFACPEFANMAERTSDVQALVGVCFTASIQYGPSFCPAEAASVYAGGGMDEGPFDKKAGNFAQTSAPDQRGEF